MTKLLSLRRKMKNNINACRAAGRTQAMPNGLIKLIAALLLFNTTVFSCISLTGCRAEEKKYEAQLFAMDTVIDLCFYGSDGSKTVSAELNRLESLFSVTREKSDISKINNSNGTAQRVSDDTLKVLEYADKAYSMSNGLFDPTIYPLLKLWGFTTDKYKVPSDSEISRAIKAVDYSRVKTEGNYVSVPKGTQLDLGGIGKGYAGDKCREQLLKSNIKSAVVTLGGNVCTIGLKPDGSKWRIALKNPDGGDYLCSIDVGECSVVTSGGYERRFESEGKVYHHIIDPRTGKPADSGFKSVTVICHNGAMADALSTAFFIGGEELIKDCLKKDGDIEAIAYANDGRLLISRGLESDVVLNGAVREDKVEIIN